jgi:hypothetical protein
MAKNIKKLVAERRKPVVAHHSTWLGIDPHDLNYETSIHVGTKQAAYDRLEEGLDVTVRDSDYEEGEQMDAYLHSYEIPRSAINPKMHLDPDSPKVLRHSNTSRTRMKKAPQKLVPETTYTVTDFKTGKKTKETYGNKKDNTVIQYKNTHEDPDSTSYVVASNLINSGRVKHLGSQFIVSYDLGEDGVGDFKTPKVE